MLLAGAVTVSTRHQLSASTQSASVQRSSSVPNSIAYPLLWNDSDLVLSSPDESRCVWSAHRPNPPVPPMNLIFGYSIAGLYNLELVNP